MRGVGGVALKTIEPYCTKSNLPVNSWHQPFNGMRVLMDVNSPWVGISTQEIPKHSVLCKCYPEAQRKETGGESQAVVGEIKRSREEGVLVLFQSPAQSQSVYPVIRTTNFTVLRAPCSRMKHGAGVEGM